MIEISRVELELHILKGLERFGVRRDVVTIVADAEGGWRIDHDAGDAARQSDFARAAKQVEDELGKKYRIHRLSRGGAYGG
jgi:hypothetical protein